MTPELSILVVLYQSGGTLASCLRSIRSDVDSGFAELIAVDNASPDDSSTVLRRELSSATLVELAENRGFAAGVNAILPRASGRYWMLLNPDVVVAPGGARRLVQFMDLHPRIGLGSPDLRSAGGDWEAPGRALPSVARTALEMSRLHRLLPASTRGRILRGGYWTGGEQLDVGWVPATAPIVRPAAVRDVGLMREDLFMYGEDLEWCWRMRKAGWRTGVCDSTTFVHATSSSVLRTMGDAERRRRISSGTHSACRIMYGETHARVLAATTACALSLEALAPGRSPSYRREARNAARLWSQLVWSRPTPQ